MSDYTTHPQYAFELIDLINAYRAANGVQPLLIDHTLMDLGQSYTDYLKSTGQFSHTADGQYPWTRIANSGFIYEDGLTGSKIGNENLHYGYSSKDGYDTPQEALDGWINSSGHNRNMLNPEWDRVGIGYNKGLYTAEFGDGPDLPANIPTPSSDPGSFGVLKSVSFEVATAGRVADYAIVRLTNVIDQDDSSASIKFTALLDGKVVGTGTVNVPEGSSNVKVDTTQGFDEVRLQASEADVTGVVSGVNFTLLPDSEPLSSPLPGTFGPSKTLTYGVDDNGAVADYVVVTVDDVLDQNGTLAKIQFKALLDGDVVVSSTIGVHEDGPTKIKFNPPTGFDEVKIVAAEPDVTGIVTDVDWTLIA